MQACVREIGGKIQTLEVLADLSQRSTLLLSLAGLVADPADPIAAEADRDPIAVADQMFEQGAADQRHAESGVVRAAHPVTVLTLLRAVVTSDEDSVGCAISGDDLQCRLLQARSRPAAESQ